MKTLLIATIAGLLAACSALPSTQVQYGGTAATASPAFPLADDRLHHRAYYEDADSTPAWMKVAPHNNR